MLDPGDFKFERRTVSCVRLEWVSVPEDRDNDPLHLRPPWHIHNVDLALYLFEGAPHCQ